MSKRLKIVIVTQSHLCRNPRALKAALAIAGAGYELLILNTVTSQQLRAEDQEALKDFPGIRMEPVADLTQRGFNAFADRVIFKLGALMVSMLGIQSFLALGYGAFKYFKRCRAAQGDLYICHQELATYIGCRLLKAGFKVAFDLEDWYSEDLLLESRAKRPIGLLRRSESRALLDAAFCTTTSCAMAEALSLRYKSRLPAVVYNVFPQVPLALPDTKVFIAPLKLFWFSQTIGPGRGIEEFIRLSDSFTKGHELHLLGRIAVDYREHLNALMPEHHRVFFHPLVAERELIRRISAFDVGLALERTVPPSRNYTITNKFFQYIEAGLPVIATETAGQQEIFEKFSVGLMLNQAPQPTEVRRLDNWLNDPEALSRARFTALQASLFYNWESQEQILLTLIQRTVE